MLGEETCRIRYPRDYSRGKSCIDHNRVVPEEEAGASENKLNDTAESESIENIMEEVERISREVKEGKEDDKKVSAK